jgi:3-oxoacyl-[acyl-carrier-protein] synthase II
MAPVFVHGVGLRTPLGSSPEVVLDRLCGLETAFGPYAPFRHAGIRFPFAAPVQDDDLPIPPFCAADDRGTRLLDAAVRDALCDATGARDLSATGVTPDRIALVVGTSSSGIGPFCDAVRSGAARSDASYGSAATLVAVALGVRGPVITTCNVCASGSLAIAEGADLLDAGIADVVIAAGVDPLEPFVGSGFDALGTLVERPRPFRAGRRGFVLGEGAAALVLARSPAARSPGRGIVLGWGSSSDAHHITAPHPEGEGLVLAIRRALACAAIPQDDIPVVNAHGTGTVYNDAMEARALRRVFGSRAPALPLYTVKGSIGHTLGAAGAIEAVVSLLAMRAGVVPPTVTEGDPDPDCDVDVVLRARPMSYRRTLSLSAGFGGTNCALVLTTGEEITS